jgi:hypothetical protein
MGKTEQEFLEALTKLSNEYGYHIWGCGCCGSPGIDSHEGEGYYLFAVKGQMEDLRWVQYGQA